jgi:hypothetical protein
MFGKAVVVDVVGETLTMEMPTKFIAERAQQDFGLEVLALLFSHWCRLSGQFGWRRQIVGGGGMRWRAQHYSSVDTSAQLLPNGSGPT